MLVPVCPMPGSPRCRKLEGLSTLSVGGGMGAPQYVDGVSHHVDSLLVFCARCAHSEFIHRDRGARGCLYSVCECASFGATEEAKPSKDAQRGPGVRGRTAPKRRERGGSAHRRVREADGS